MGALSSIASAVGASSTSEPVTCGMAEFDLTTATESAKVRAFQYFPETINDSKSPEWVRRMVAGGSHPIVSFVNGGERTISFTAIFTQEKNPEESGLISGLLTGSLSLSATSKRKSSMDAGIGPAVAWLRSFTYPEYLKNGVAKPPPAAVVYLPNSDIVGTGQVPGSIVGVMTECNVTYEAFHRNGAPRIVAVSLSFVEIAQTSFAWRFQGRETFLETVDLYNLPMVSPDASSSAGGFGGLF